MLSAYTEEKEGVSLLSGTGVEERDLLQVIPNFMDWAEKHKNANILKFFTTAHVKGKVIGALALIGLKTIIDEFNNEVIKVEDVK